MKIGNLKDVEKNLQAPDTLIAAVVQDRSSKEVLMLAWMNHEALKKTFSTKQATFWSRSRSELWVKGESSGNRMHVTEIRYDCDGDALLLLVDAAGPACHTGESSCFHTHLELSEEK